MCGPAANSWSDYRMFSGVQTQMSNRNRRGKISHEENKLSVRLSMKPHTKSPELRFWSMLSDPRHMYVSCALRRFPSQIKQLESQYLKWQVGSATWWYNGMRSAALGTCGIQGKRLEQFCMPWERLTQFETITNSDWLHYCELSTRNLRLGITP